MTQKTGRSSLETSGKGRAAVGDGGCEQVCLLASVELGKHVGGSWGAPHPRAGPALSLGHSPEARVLVDRFIGEEEGLGSASFHRAGFDFGQREPRAA